MKTQAVSFDTVDCGAQKNQWNETIVQLWVPEDEENGEFMTSPKFLSIYDKVASLIPLDPMAEIPFEYGNENFPLSNYHVENINENRTELCVQLRLPQATCKAHDRRKAGTPLLQIILSTSRSHPGQCDSLNGYNVTNAAALTLQRFNV